MTSRKAFNCGPSSITIEVVALIVAVVVAVMVVAAVVVVVVASDSPIPDLDSHFVEVRRDEIGPKDLSNKLCPS